MSSEKQDPKDIPTPTKEAQINLAEWATDCSQINLNVSNGGASFNMYLYRNGRILAGWNPKLHSPPPSNYTTPYAGGGGAELDPCATYTLEVEDGDLDSATIDPCEGAVCDEAVAAIKTNFNVAEGASPAPGKHEVVVRIPEDDYVEGAEIDVYCFELGRTHHGRGQRSRWVTPLGLSPRKGRVPDVTSTTKVKDGKFYVLKVEVHIKDPSKYAVCARVGSGRWEWVAWEIKF